MSGAIPNHAKKQRKNETQDTWKARIGRELTLNSLIRVALRDGCTGASSSGVAKDIVSSLLPSG
jgi:hypothetical protein